MVAARLGRSRKQPIRKDWDKARNSVMALAIEAKFSQEIGNGPKEILFHGHCQQKSLFGTENSLQTLSALEKTHLLEVDSGCCGMAGSFGYEKVTTIYPNRLETCACFLLYKIFPPKQK